MVGGGRRGGPVGSFARTSLSHSSLQRHAPRHVPVPKSMQLVHSLRKQTISACHRQLLITASHRWKVLDHYLPVMAGFVLRARFTFAGHRSKYIRERLRFQFRHTRSKFSVSSPTDKPNRKYRWSCTLRPVDVGDFVSYLVLRMFNTGL